MGKRKETTEKSKVRSKKTIHAGKGKVTVQAKARCQRCRGSLFGFMPNIHHKNGNPLDNSPNNLIALCQICHDKEHMLCPNCHKKG
jgi:hypothetical protein